MKKRLTRAIAAVLTAIYLFSTFSAYADTPFSGGSGGTGVGSFDNGWLIDIGGGVGLYDAEGIRVYLAQGGRDANGKETGSGEIVSKVIDLSNQALPPDIVMWNSNGKTKVDYKYKGAQLGASGWSTKYSYEQLQNNKLPAIVGWGEPESVSKIRIEAIKNWFFKNDDANIKFILNFFGVQEDEATDKQWYLMFEPVIYFRYLGNNYALTPTECAVFDKFTKENPTLFSKSLAGAMGTLTHQNAPLAVYLTEDLFLPYPQGNRMPEWKGAKTTKTSMSYDDMRDSLGIGCRRPPLPDKKDLPDLKFNLTASPKDKKVEGTAIGDDVMLTIDPYNENKEVADFLDAVSKNAGKTKVKVTVSIKRTGVEGAEKKDGTPVPLDGTGITWLDQSKSWLSVNPIDIEASELKKIICVQNEINEKILLMDKSATHIFAANSNEARYDYEASMSITCTIPPGYKEENTQAKIDFIDTKSKKITAHDYANFKREPFEVAVKYGIKALPKNEPTNGNILTYFP